MDSIDHAIIFELEQDARLSNVDLADRVGLSPSPTLRRVRALEQDGVITGYHARVDPARVGKGFRVLVWVDLVKSTSDAIETFEHAVLDIDRQRIHGWAFAFTVLSAWWSYGGTGDWRQTLELGEHLAAL